jgi:ferrous iron transport protein B
MDSATAESPPTRPPAADPPRRLTVALVGNPNTGKTTLFNALAGMRQRVGNYPGVTVETKKGHVHHGPGGFDLIDLPGTYSLAPRSPDEMVAVDLILGHQPGEPRPDVIVSIVDASNLERNLYLTTQLLDLGRPVVVALNMIDIAQSQGRPVDAERLQKQLGLRVVPIQANKKRGLDQLKEAILAAAGDGPPARRPSFPAAFEQEVAALRAWTEQRVEDFFLRRLLLDVGGFTETRLAERFGPPLREQLAAARERLAAAGCPVPAVEARTRYAWVREATQGCVARTAARPITWTDRLDRVLTHKLWGTLLFLALMFIVFLSIYSWAEPLMGAVEWAVGQLAEVVNASLSPGPLRSLLADGVIGGVGGVLVFLPQIVILFGFIAILEDCGYMARAAFLMDKVMARCGLSGKSFIPMLSSFACAIPGVMATRVIEDRRDRLTTILVAPLMSCSARLPVYTLLIAAFIPTDTALGPVLPALTLFGMYLLGIVIAPLVALALKRTLLRGETPVFVMELPPYKLPSVRMVLFRMYDRGKAFIVRAGTLILASMVVVWALLYFPRTGTDAAGQPFAYDERIEAVQQQLEAEVPEAERAEYAELQEQLAAVEEELAAADADPALQARRDELRAKLEPLRAKLEPFEDEINRLKGEWKAQSLLGRMGHAIEPAVDPLGWDWRVGMAALASFPAREVVVGTLGIIYNVGEQDEKSASLRERLQAATWDEGSPRAGEPVFTIPAALSLMVFFALCCQCASTLAVIRRETNSWRWPLFTFAYMTALAYVAALATYQVGRLFL